MMEQYHKSHLLHLPYLYDQANLPNKKLKSQLNDNYHHQRIEQPVLYTRRGSISSPAHTDPGRNSVGSDTNANPIALSHSELHRHSNSGEKSPHNHNSPLNHSVASSQHFHKLGSHPPEVKPQTAEDLNFLRLAREALVATATGVHPLASKILDPTIQDLLTRLQYASSPHGNPIKQSSSITTNDAGRLNIQEFYKQFPNLSNDIFTGSPRMFQLEASNHPSSNSDGWNFLIGQNPLKKEYVEASNHSSGLYDRHGQQKEEEDEDDIDDEDSNTRKLSSNDPQRKFLCANCNQTFRRSSDLKRHEKQHLTIPPSICDLCGKGFARKDALKRHKGTLTCKRNTDKKLYIDNLNYLNLRKHEG